MTNSNSGGILDRSVEEFERILSLLESARSFAKGVHQNRLLGLTQRALAKEGGVEALYAFAPRFSAAGVFAGTDWDNPASLQPSLVRAALTDNSLTSALECLSELRFLAIAMGEAVDEQVSATQARAFLEDSIARNLDLVFPEATEESRQTDAAIIRRVQRLLGFFVETLGSTNIFDSLIAECERVLLQRPVMVHRVEQMLSAAKRALRSMPDEELYSDSYARQLLDALDGPSELSQRCWEPQSYARELEGLSPEDLRTEAQVFGQCMDETGLVCRLHAVLLRFLAEASPQLLPAALALNNVGRTSLVQHGFLVRQVIAHAVHPDTARCIYGLSRLLNRGILFFRPVGPGLQRIMLLPILPAVAEQLQRASELDQPPDASVLLLAGTLSVIGQPRGVDQGHNPTCQAARAISLWSQNDVGYLLELIARAARDGDVVMHFEGEAVRSSALSKGLAQELHTELDPVSLVLTPHLDRIYFEMGRRTIGRKEDAHRWVNPAFHGWWVYRGFASLVNPATGAIQDFEGYMRLFYAAYHPLYNGGRELVYAQPCGIVSTDANAEFFGYHAVSIQRLALDPQGEWRVYFFNPNRDKGQNWGQGIVTSTHDHGELEGESSLPVEQFLMRLYVFHYTRREMGDRQAVSGELIEQIREVVAAGWAAERDWEAPPGGG